MVSVAWAAAVITVAGGAGCSSSSSGPDGGYGGSPGHGGAAGGSSVGGRPPGTGGTPMGGAGGGRGGAGGGTGGAGEAPGSGGAGEAPGSGGAAGTPAGGGGGPGSGGAAGTPTGGAGGGGGGQPGCSIPSGPAGTWVEIPAPSGQSNFNIGDAFAAGSDDLLFAGNTFDPTGLAAPTNARLLRWTRGCWTVELMIPPSATTPDHPSVHGTGPNDLWATASDLLYHRDAQGWTPFADQTWHSMVHPPAYSSAIQFNRVRAAAPNDVWIAATSNILHWSGASWTTYNFDDPGFPNTSAAVGYSYADIWIDSPTNVWLVGEGKQVGNTMSPGVVHHFNGTNWTRTPTTVGTIDAIWRAGVLWLAQPSEDGLTLRSFDGTSATGVQIAGAAPFVDMTSLFGRGTNDLWAAGGDVAHFDGQGWSQAADAPAAARNSMNLVTNTFVTGDAGSVWLVTPGPRFFRKVTAP